VEVMVFAAVDLKEPAGREHVQNCLTELSSDFETVFEYHVPEEEEEELYAEDEAVSRVRLYSSSENIRDSVLTMVKAVEKLMLLAKKFFIGARLTFGSCEEAGRFAESVSAMDSSVIVWLCDRKVDVIVVNSLDADKILKVIECR